MTNRTILGVYAPPPRPTRAALVFLALVAGVVVVLLGLALDSFLAPYFNSG